MSDIFISYAHVDNQPLGGDDKGWITHFVNNLRNLVTRKRGRPESCDLWMDFRLPGAVGVTPEIEAQLRAAHTLVLFLSPAWLASDWCRAELALFSKHHAAHAGRIFVVEIDAIDKATQAPANLRDLKGYRFWEQSDQDKVRQLGWPLPLSGQASHTAYFDRLTDLATEVAQTLAQTPAIADIKATNPKEADAEPPPPLSRQGPFELALELIAKNKETKAVFLDLGNCGLTAVPAEIGELGWLESVSLATRWFEWDGNSFKGGYTQNKGNSNNGLVDISALAGLGRLRKVALSGTNVTDLSPLANLTQLQALCLWDAIAVTDLSPLAKLGKLQFISVRGTQVIDLSPLASLSLLQEIDLAATGITDIAPLTNLINLRVLYLQGTPIADLGPLRGLTRLQNLHLANTHSLTDLSPLAGLVRLWQLLLSATHATDLAPLSGLVSLESLFLENSLIADVGPLARLFKLKKLNISNTQVKDLTPLRQLIDRGLPVRWSSHYSKGNAIYVGGCNLLHPPIETVEKGNDAILAYFAEREREAEAPPGDKGEAGAPALTSAQALPVGKPLALRDWARADDLVLRFQYAALPAAIIKELATRLRSF